MQHVQQGQQQKSHCSTPQGFRDVRDPGVNNANVNPEGQSGHNGVSGHNLSHYESRNAGAGGNSGTTGGSAHTGSGADVVNSQLKASDFEGVAVLSGEAAAEKQKTKEESNLLGNGSFGLYSSYHWSMLRSTVIDIGSLVVF